MFRYKMTKDSFIRQAVLLGTVSLLGFGGAAAVQAEICDDNEYVLADSADGYGVTVYDKDGSFVRNLDLGTAIYGLMRIPNDLVVLQRRNDEWIPFSFPLMEELPPIPVNHTQVATWGSYYAIANADTGSFEVLDETGTIRYHMDMAQDPSQYTSVGFLRIGDQFIAAASQEDHSVGILFDEDGNAVSELDNDEIEREVSNGLVVSIGEYVVLYDHEMYRFCDLEGNVLLTSPEVNLLSDFSDSMYEYYQPDRDRIEWALVSIDGIKHLFDQNLDEHEWNPDYTLPELRRGYLQGMVYEELGNRVCAGFVKDGKGVYYPYAIENNYAYILTDNPLTPLLEVMLNGDEKPLCHNDDYVVTTRPAEDYEEILTVYTVPEGDAFYNSGPGYSGSNRVQVSEDRLMTEEELDTPDGQDYPNYGSVLWDEDQEETYEDVSSYSNLQYWGNNLWLTRRGIYTGLIDGNGDWAFRVNGWQE